jgi:hypothetical protein
MVLQNYYPTLIHQKQQVRDELKPKRELTHNISPILCLLFKISLETGVVPTELAHCARFTHLQERV